MFVYKQCHKLNEGNLNITFVTVDYLYLSSNPVQVVNNPPDPAFLIRNAQLRGELLENKGTGCSSEREQTQG